MKRTSTKTGLLLVLRHRSRKIPCLYNIIYFGWKMQFIIGNEYFKIQNQNIFQVFLLLYVQWCIINFYLSLCEQQTLHRCITNFPLSKRASRLHLSCWGISWTTKIGLFTCKAICQLSRVSNNFHSRWEDTS